MKKATKARREKNPYNDIWLFFDHDNSPHLEEVFTICDHEGFVLAYSAISLEFWFILHFEDCGRAFSNGEECLRYLTKLWPAYHKTKLDHFKLLLDRLPIAKERAIRINQRVQDQLSAESNPYTSVYDMVNYFIALDNE